MFNMAEEVILQKGQRMTRAALAKTLGKEVSLFKKQHVYTPPASFVQNPRGKKRKTKESPTKKRQSLKKRTRVAFVPEEKLPNVFEELVSQITADLRSSIDEFRVQTELINRAGSGDYIGENGLEQIKEDVLKLVMDDRLPKTTMGHRRVESLWVDHQIIGDALERYRLYVESEEQQKLRNYHTDNYAWTEEDIDRFLEVWRRLGGNTKSTNALIGQELGVHPNHVAHLRRKLRGDLDTVTEEESLETLGAADASSS